MRLVGVAADDVAKEAQAVLVGPLEVVEEDRERAHRGQLGDGHGGKVVGAKELLVRREARERRVVPAGERVERAPHGRSGRGGAGQLLDGPASEDRAGEQEGTAQLLVRGDALPRGSPRPRRGPGPP